MPGGGCACPCPRVEIWVLLPCATAGRAVNYRMGCELQDGLCLPAQRWALSCFPPGMSPVLRGWPSPGCGVTVPGVPWLWAPAFRGPGVPRCALAISSSFQVPRCAPAVGSSGPFRRRVPAQPPAELPAHRSRSRESLAPRYRREEQPGLGAGGGGGSCGGAELGEPGREPDGPRGPGACAERGGGGSGVRDPPRPR